MRKLALAVVWLVGVAAIGPVAAQGVLERLERQIRKQLPPESSASQGAQERGYLGIVTDDRQDRGRGVRILQVRPGDPGDKAGLRAQDLITGLGGIRVRQMSDLGAILEQVPPGSSLPFDIVRDQQRLKIEVVFGKRPPSNEEPAAQPPAGPPLVAPEFPDPAAAKPSPSPPTPEMPPPAVAPPAAGESPQGDRARIEALERRVKQLEERLQQLEHAMPRRLKRE